MHFSSICIEPAMNNSQSLLETLENSRDRVLSLLNSLSPEQLQVPYSEGINPPVWEVGHATFFFERFILQHLDSAPSYNPALDDVWDSFELAHEDRWLAGLFPDKAETLHYFHHTFDRVKQRIQEKPLSDADLYLYKYSIFHLNMHIESMVWCRQTLGYPPPPGAHTLRGASTATLSTPGDVEIPAGRYRIGMAEESPNYAGEDFCFDNEKPGFVKEVKAFKISPTLVSNAEYLAFVEAGGYEQDSCWSMAGLKWRKQTNTRHPLYWKKKMANGWNAITTSGCPLNPTCL